MTESERATALVGGALAMFVLVGSAFLAEYLAVDRAQKAVTAAVSNASGARLDGQPLDDPSVLLHALRTLRHRHAHHSFPRASIRIQLVGGAGVTEVVIARDSDTPHEFWAFRPGPSWPNHPLGQEVGGLRSEELDAFLARRGL